MLTSKSIKMVWSFKLVVVFMIVYDIFIQERYSMGVKSALIAGLLLLQGNDVLRTRFHLLERHRILYTVSMLLNIAAIGSLMVLCDTPATGIYYAFPIVEIFLTSGELQIGYIVFHVLVFLAGMVVSRSDVQNSVIAYFAMLLLVYLFRGISLEKEKGHILNMELAEAHTKLKEITIVKERTRIAQDLHDSIGHSLIALRMHLEFAETLIKTDPEKVEPSLTKAHQFSQKSIKELRRAVAVLKDQTVDSPILLEELLSDLIESLQTSGTLQFTLNFDKKVESRPQDWKNGIYNTVRESITNGLKHGKAQTFWITVTQSEQKLQVTVEDDGIGCEHIHKSHGLKGIEERIGLLNGRVTFLSEKGHGFKVEAEIPVKENKRTPKMEVV